MGDRIRAGGGIMIATFLDLRIISYSIYPKLQFRIELTNENADYHAWIYGWTGEIYLQAPKHILIGNISTDFRVSHLASGGKTQIDVGCELSPEKLDAIEDARQGENMQIGIILKVLSAFIPKTAQPPYDISSFRSEEVTVQSPTGNRVVEIPRSLWDDSLGKLNYQSIMTLRLPFPPPPLGTQLDKSINHLKNAQKKINDGEWADSLSSCRKSIEELQKIIGHDEEKQKAFFLKLLEDEEKAKDCRKLWDEIQKAENFASGGPHTYWVRTADKRDAELVIRVVSAFVHYFAHNLARASTR
jgi:hypothetical protein